MSLETDLARLKETVDNSCNLIDKLRSALSLIASLPCDCSTRKGIRPNEWIGGHVNTCPKLIAKEALS